MISAMMRDYEQQIEDLTQRLNDACVDLVETRAKLAGRRKLYEALIGLYAEAIGQASRYRLAWQSARRRARRIHIGYDTTRVSLEAVTRSLKRAVDERDEARAEVVRLGKESDELRTTIANMATAYHATTSALTRQRVTEGRAQRSDAATAADRLRQRIEPL